MIYVWAIEQDELSKRAWVFSKPPAGDEPPTKQVYNRYYHMFAKGELPALVSAAAKDMGLVVGPRAATGQEAGVAGLDIVQDGWERSNYFVELHRWTS